LGRTVLASQEFAKSGGDALRAIGSFAVAGFAEEQAAFGLVTKDWLRRKGM
jgi:hypothetical protein